MQHPAPDHQKRGAFLLPYPIHFFINRVIQLWTVMRRCERLIVISKVELILRSQPFSQETVIYLIYIALLGYEVILQQQLHCGLHGTG